MKVTLLPRDVMAQRLCNTGADQEAVISIINYLGDRMGTEIEVKADIYSFIDENGAMLSPVCFDLRTIRI